MGTQPLKPLGIQAHKEEAQQKALSPPHLKPANFKKPKNLSFGGGGLRPKRENWPPNSRPFGKPHFSAATNEQMFLKWMGAISPTLHPPKPPTPGKQRPTNSLGTDGPSCPCWWVPRTSVPVSPSGDLVGPPRWPLGLRSLPPHPRPSAASLGDLDHLDHSLGPWCVPHPHNPLHPPAVLGQSHLQTTLPAGI